MQGSVTRMVMHEVEKVRREVAQHKMKSETIDASRAELLKELDSTNRRLVSLKADLDKVEAEESRAKQELNCTSQYLEIAQIFAQEGGKGEKLNMVKKRQETAISDLNLVKEEIKSLKEECANLAKEKKSLVAKAEEAVAASKNIEKRVEELTEELATVKKSQEVATVAKLEAEESKISVSVAKDEDCLLWEKEMKQAEEELRQLNMQIASAKELEGKLETATGLLEKLNAELAVYIEKLNREKDAENDEDEKKKQEMLDSKTKELEEVKVEIDKVQGEVDVIQVEVSSLKTVLEKEKIELANWQQREELASVVISSVKTEIEKTKEQINASIEKEKEAKKNIVELPDRMKEAAQEAEQSNSVAQLARGELNKADEEAETVKVSLKTTEMKIHATVKEIEASKMSENIALEAIKALQESEMDASSEKVTISFDEYFTLSKQGLEAAEQAQERVNAATAQYETAKESATNSLAKLYKVYNEREEKKKVLHEAKQKASRAAQSKMDAEQELKHWRAKSEEQNDSDELNKEEAVKEAVKTDKASTEVVKSDSATNGVVKTDEDNKEAVKTEETVNEEARINEPNKEIIDKSNLENSFERSSGCCLSSRSFRSEDAEMFGYSTPGDSPMVMVGTPKKKKKNFFRKFWAKRKAQSVVA